MRNLMSNDEITALVDSTCSKCKKYIGAKMMGIVPECSKGDISVCQAEFILLKLISLGKDCYFIFESHEITLQLTEEDENNDFVWIISFTSDGKKISIGRISKKTKSFKKCIKNAKNKHLMSVKGCCRMLKNSNIFPLPDDKFFIDD